MSEEDKKQLIIDYMQTFESPHGQRVLADLKKRSNILLALTPLDKNGRLDSHMMAYQNGRKSNVMHIYSQLRKDPYAVKQDRAINEREKEDG